MDDHHGNVTPGDGAEWIGLGEAARRLDVTRAALYGSRCSGLGGGARQQRLSGAGGALQTVGNPWLPRSRRSGSVLMIRAGLILFVLLAAAVPAGAHGWYTGLRNRSGISCCEDKDCRPVRLCILPDRKEGLLIEGVCRPIPWGAIGCWRPGPRSVHACWQSFGHPPAVRCVILPGET